MGRVVGEARQSRGDMRDMSPKGQRGWWGGGVGRALADSSRLTPVALVIEGKQEGNLLIG